ncbi:uncharacterized protein LOC132760480 [Ruditapes philippinarum]|uniref:uncharacterized protein LOC132760480 n=1 Tax=Ruditapes philippinarum TaxID=129788 RepID=UPI00295B2F63|nr:uncharacterized protein LOC132760480 [Ruditapes philippinarum]
MSTQLNIRLKDGQNFAITANIVPTITGSIQRKPVSISNNGEFRSLIKNLTLADDIPTEEYTDSIDLLFGNDYYLDIVLGHKIEIQPGLYLLSSKLGWILSGRTSEIDDSVTDANMLILSYGNNITKTQVFTTVDTCVPKLPDIEDFWNIETIGLKDSTNERTDQAIDKFKESLVFKDNRYYVKWPWRGDNYEVPENRPLAFGRLKSLVKRFKDNLDVLQKYDSVIQDQLEKGIIEKVETSEQNGHIHYLPHHAVIKPDKSTTKLRIVYDASAKSKVENNSLNDCLYKGPVLLNDLCGILLRFRLHKIGIVSDIEKAFLQVGLQKDQRDVTRFIWLKDIEHPDISQNQVQEVQEYRFCGIPFGIVSSPFLLGATIDYHLECYNNEIAKKLRRDIYMDNVVTRTENVEAAKYLYIRSKRIFDDASMNLLEWASNRDVTESILPENRANETVLGLEWNRHKDTLAIQKVNKSTTQCVTKRVILSKIASVFDPLGIFSPVTLRGKVLIQTLWKKKVDWDQPIDEEDIVVWHEIQRDLSEISEHATPRCTVSEVDNKNILVCFCDASTKAYATVIYLMQKGNSQQHIEIVFSKTRLAPTSNISIPRLELLAVLIGVQCLAFIQEQIKMQIDEVHLFSDSQLGHLKRICRGKSFPFFVRNPVNEIKTQQMCPSLYVTLEQSRFKIAIGGFSTKDLVKNSSWWHGPECYCKTFPKGH